jgi:large subunit ribosomal protein L25
VAESKIQAESRTEFGKGAARRIRRADKVPAVLYGHGAAPLHITLPGHETMLALKHGGSNALLTIAIGDKSQLALPKQVQRDPIKGFIEHVDLIVVTKGEKVTVEIPVHVVGQPGPDTLVVTEYNSVLVEAEATHIPEYVEVSVEGAPVGTQILAKDLKLPAGSTIQLDDDSLVVHVVGQQSAEALEEELAEAEAEVGIERDESDEEIAAESGTETTPDDEKSDSE